VRWKTFTSFYSKFIQETVYQISSESPEFCVRYYQKHFGLFVSGHTVEDRMRWQQSDPNILSRSVSLTNRLTRLTLMSFLMILVIRTGSCVVVNVWLEVMRGLCTTDVRRYCLFSAEDSRESMYEGITRRLQDVCVGTSWTCNDEGYFQLHVQSVRDNNQFVSYRIMKLLYVICIRHRPPGVSDWWESNSTCLSTRRAFPDCDHARLSTAISTWPLIDWLDFKFHLLQSRPLRCVIWYLLQRRRCLHRRKPAGKFEGDENWLESK